MILYNVRLGLKSLRRNPWLTLLTISGIALGITVATTLATTRHVIARPPLPDKKSTLHYVRLDNWDPERPYPGDDPKALPTQITYRDMVELMHSEIPVRQTGSFKTTLAVFPAEGKGRPSREYVRMVFSDFFPMFEVPFEYGTAWGRDADEHAGHVAVISAAMNDRLFGGVDSVGKIVRIGDEDFQVVGVLAPWRPSVKIYDPTQNYFSEPEPIFLPFNLLVPMKLGTAGNSDGWGPSPTAGFDGFLQAETCWVQFWVELPDAARKRAYVEFVASYIADQKRLGRFQRPLNYRVSTIAEVMSDQKIVPKEATALMVVSFLFLAVCAVNLMGLLLGKFLARSAEVGVRRALGATRTMIFVQHIVECELVGLAGGIIGLLLSVLSLFAINRLLPFGNMFRLDVPMVALSIGLALLAGLIAGIHPAWRICRTAPAVHLKLQ